MPKFQVPENTFAVVPLTRDELEFIVDALKFHREESTTVLPAREQLYERLFDTLHFDRKKET